MKFSARNAFVSAALLSLVSIPAQAEFTEKQFQVVGTWANLENYKLHESRYWEQILPEMSGGKLTANMKDYTNVGMSGFEAMRLLKLGTFDAVHALATYTAQDAPALEGIDLAGVIQDFATYRKAMDAYKGVIERELKEKFNAKLLSLYTFPNQQLFCNFGGKDATDVHLKDLKGKKLRTYSVSIGDFIEGLGASAVTIPFAEVVPALQKGVADCGATGTMPAYNAKWWQVVTHNVRVNIGYAATFLAVNNDVWESLSPESQALMQEQATAVENDIWSSTEALSAEAAKCNTDGPCEKGEPGGMVAVELNDDDKAIVANAVENFVVKRWAERCGSACAKEWNETIGAIIDMKAPE